MQEITFSVMGDLIYSMEIPDNVKTIKFVLKPEEVFSGITVNLPAIEMIEFYGPNHIKPAI